MQKYMNEFDIKRQELLAVHSCIMIVLNNDIPSPSDAAMLMETMSEIASKDKDTKKEFKLKLKSERLVPLWHCCNIVLQNNLHKDHIHATEISQIMSKLAITIDQNAAMEKKPQLELVK